MLGGGLMDAVMLVMPTLAVAHASNCVYLCGRVAHYRLSGDTSKVARPALCPVLRVGGDPRPGRAEVAANTRGATRLKVG